MRWTSIAAACFVLVTGCGGGAKVIVRPPTVAPSLQPTTQTPSVASSASTQRVSVSPATGLQSPQTVHLRGSGFTAGKALVVTECADKGAATSSADCNLSGLTPVSANAAGEVVVDITVVKGPFGANNVVCSSAQRCLVSVTEATPNPSEEADAPISFR